MAVIKDERTEERLLADWKTIVRAVFAAESAKKAELDKFLVDCKELDNGIKTDHYCEVVAREILANVEAQKAAERA